jgi:hypothetical protein
MSESLTYGEVGFGGGELVHAGIVAAGALLIIWGLALGFTGVLLFFRSLGL